MSRINDLKDIFGDAGESVDDRLTALRKTTESHAEAIDALERRVGETGDALSLGADEERQVEYPHHAGIVIEPSESLDGLSVRLSSMTRRAHTARIQTTSGDVVAEQDTTMAAPGEWVAFNCELKGGERYHVVAGPNERLLARGRVQVDYPIKGDRLDVVAGSYTNGENTSDSWRYCFDAIAPDSGFEDRDRQWSAIDDVPPSAELTVASAELDLSGDVGAEVQDWLDGLPSDACHCLVMPYSGDYQWDTYASRKLVDAEYVGLIAPEGATATYEIGHCIDHPLNLGGYGEGPREVVVRNLRWDITGSDPGGYPVDTGFLRATAENCVLIEGCRRIGRRERFQKRDGEWEVFGDVWSMRVHAANEDAVGVVRDNYNGGGVHHPIAEEPGNTGEGVGFSAEANVGAIDWLGNVDDGSVGNVFYMHAPTSDQSHNYVVGNSISDHCRCAIRIGANDVARDNYVQLSDTEGRYYATCVWLNHGRPVAEGIEIDAPDGNHELVRDTSDGGTLRDSRVHAGPDNDSFCLRANCATVVEDTEFIDESDELSDERWPGALHFNEPGAVLRNVTIDVSNSPRDPWSGEDPELVDCEIIE